MSSPPRALGPGDMAEGPGDSHYLWLIWGSLSQAAAEQRPRHCGQDQAGV